VSDRYEAQFMDGEHAFFREKHVARWFAAMMCIQAAVIAIIGLLVAATGPVGAAGLPALVAAVLVALGGLYFAVMRVAVTPTTIEVRYGNLGPSIPVDALTSCEVVKLDVLSRIAFGPKWEGPGAWRYIPPGVGEGVRVRWTEGKRKRTALIGARDAVALAAAIERARAGASAGGLRMAEIDLDDEAALAEAEAEAEAEAAAEADAAAEARARHR
jgi:hypothetical protein